MWKPPSLDDETRERIAGRTIVASISGGKDSAAMGLWLREQGLEHERVFADTGWEHPDTLAYLRGELTRKLGPIIEVKSERGGMAEWCLHKGMFPSRLRRFCTEELKVRPLAKHIRQRQADGGRVINAVGIRAAESAARSKLGEWEWQDTFFCDVWRPMLRWTEEDVIEMHRRHDLLPNPLYLRGAMRVGCWPCIFARKNEIRLVAEQTPSKIDEIEELEEQVAQRAEARYAAKGETFESKGYERPCFFQTMGALRKEGGKEGRGVAIRAMVEWARTAHGGRQFELDLPRALEDMGCMRWGLCDQIEKES